MPKKATSQRVSRIAGRILRKLTRASASRGIIYMDSDFILREFATVEELRAVCASAVSQDETPAPKPKKRAKKGRR